MVFGRGGREKVIDDLHKLWKHYKEIVSKQHHLRTDLEHVYHLEKREADLKKHLSRIRSVKDIDRAGAEARKIIEDEFHYIKLIEHNVNKCMGHLKDQKSLIKRMKKDLARM